SAARASGALRARIEINSWRVSRWNSCCTARQSRTLPSPVHSTRQAATSCAGAPAQLSHVNAIARTDVWRAAQVRPRLSIVIFTLPNDQSHDGPSGSINPASNGTGVNRTLLEASSGADYRGANDFGGMENHDARSERHWRHDGDDARLC